MHRGHSCKNCMYRIQEGNQWDHYDKCTKHNIVVKGDKSICNDYKPDGNLELIKKKIQIGYKEWE